MARAVAEERNQSQRTTRFALVAALLGAATAIVHLLLLNSQTDGTNKPQAVFASSFMALMALLALFGAVAGARGGRLWKPLFLAAATGDMALGILGILSVGAPLLLAGGLLLAVNPLSAGHPARNLVPPALVIVILVLGTVLTS